MICVGFVYAFGPPGCLVALAASLACVAFGPWLASVALVTFWLLAFVAFCSYSTLAMLTWNNILLFHCYLILSFFCRLFHLLWLFDQDMAKICKNYSIIITAWERMVEVSNPTWPLLLLGVSYRSRATSAAQLGLGLMIDVVRLVSWKSMEIREPRAGLVSHLEFCFTAII